MMNIALIGFMGAGKSTFAVQLAHSLNYHLISMDLLIEHQMGMSIEQIFSEIGEIGFRKIESDLFLEALKKEQTIIDCGGGILETTANQQAMLHQSLMTVYLQCPWEMIWQRIKNSNRPLLKNKNEMDIYQLYLKRELQYEKYATLKVDATLPYQELHNLVLNNLKEHSGFCF